MMNMKKIFTLLLAAVLCVSLMAACGAEDTATANEDSKNNSESTGAATVSGEVTYRVALVDGLDQPVTGGVVVKFNQNGATAGMQTPDGNGVAEKTLPAGDYTVELQFTDEEFKYDTTNLTLTAAAPELKIALSATLGSQSQSLTIGDKNHEAFFVTVGSTAITLKADGRSYFLFVPTQSGTYEFSLTGSDAAIGYYGAPHFVQENSAAEVNGNKFQISVRPDMIGTGNTGTSTYVIGVDAGQGEAVLCIERIGEHQKTVEDEPWTEYKTSHTPAAYTLPAGTAVKSFDLTAATDTYKLVLDGNGFYHLDSENGPLVLVRLGKKADVKYLDPYETILEYTGIRCYFYKDAEKKEFDRKEKYEEIVMSYIACVDQESGLYPLTEDLKYIIQNNGSHQGWWDANGNNYIFCDEAGIPVPGINSEIAWLFMCCYAG